MVRDGPKDERKANRRGAARLAAVQALYQMDIAGTGLNDIPVSYTHLTLPTILLV